MKTIFILGNPTVHANYVNSIKRTNNKVICSYDITNLKKSDALLLTGGGDILPFYYQKPNLNAYDINFLRDKIELDAIDQAVKRKIPILGICKGMQILNVYFNGTLSSIVRKEIHQNKLKTDCYHVAYNFNNTFMYKLYGYSANINSNHHQKILKVGNNLKISSISKDMVVEAIEHKTLPIIGCQFHPERLSEIGQKVINYYLKMIN